LVPRFIELFCGAPITAMYIIVDKLIKNVAKKPINL